MNQLSLKEILSAHLAFFILVLCVRFDGLSLLPFWDDLGFYTPYAYNFYENNFVLSNKWGLVHIVHTPFFYLIIALFAKIFGWSILLIRILTFIFIASYLSALYSICRLYTDRMIAVVFTAMFFFTPVILSEAAQANADIIAATLVAWAIYFIFTRKVLTSAIFFSLGILSKATVGALMPAFLLYVIWIYKDWPTQRKNILLFSAPVAILVGSWLVLFFSTYGITVGGYPDPGDGQEYFRHGISAVFKRFFYRIFQIFVLDVRYLLILPPLLALVLERQKLFHKMRVARSEILFLAVLVFCFALFLANFGVPHQRYLIAVFPIGFILCAWASTVFVAHKKILIPVALSFCALEFFIWTTPPNRYATHEYRRTYKDMIGLTKLCVEKMNKYSTNTTVFTSWPLNHALARPFLGYTQDPLKNFKVSLDTEPLDIEQYLYDNQNPRVVLSAIFWDNEIIGGSEKIYQSIKQQFAMSCETNSSGIWKLEFCVGNFKN